MQLENTDILIEAESEWNKITIPLTRNWTLFIGFTIMLIGWIVMTGVMLIGLFRPIGGGPRIAVLLRCTFLFWLFLWYFIGKRIWRNFQLHAANREIFFIDDERITIRRPLSIFGVNDGYNREHVARFYYSDRYGLPMFDYGKRKYFFAHTLPREDAETLCNYLNKQYCASTYMLDFDDDDEE